MGSGRETIEIQGRRLAWHCVGHGPMLLLINGYASTGADWDPTFLAALAESFTVICPDNRGAGGSDLGDGELTVDGMAADCEFLLDAIGAERLPVVGWSMGGFVAQRLAVRAPDRVAALALLATDPGAPDWVPAEPSDWSHLIDPSGTSREQASRLISLLFPPELAADIDARFGDVVAEARAKLLPETLRAQEALMDAWHREELPRRDGTEAVPTLIVHGELDTVIPAANTEPLAARWPDAQVELLDGCGHALMAQEPDAAVDLIRALIENRSTRAET